MTQTPKKTVFIVGAGPGEPDFLTVVAEKLLLRADYVVCDYLVSPAVRALVPEHAELMLLKHGAGRLDDTCVFQMLADAAAEGKNVVHLKGGDPAFFGKLAEELAFFRAAGVNYAIIPGVTSAACAAACAEIPLTDAESASGVTFLTGHRRERAGVTGVFTRSLTECFSADFKNAAKNPGTLVIYMGVKTAPRWTAELLENGMPPETPVAAVQNAGRFNQKTWRCVLREVPEAVRKCEIRPPAVFIVGKVVEKMPESSFFENRPLFGQTVLVTRPAEQSAEVAEKLRALGAEVLFQPAIRISPPEDETPLRDAIKNLDAFHWVVFSSANGVQYFMQTLRAMGYDARKLAKTRLAAVGPGTAAALEAFSLVADLVPGVFRAEELADALILEKKTKLAEKPVFLLVRASRGREVLAEKLKAAGGEVTQVVAYRNEDVTHDAPQWNQQIAEEMQAGRVQWTLVTSPAIARSLARLFGETLRRTRLVSISPLTTETLTELGFPPVLEAAHATLDGMLERLSG